jgi:TatD DNase family protein
VLVANNVLDIKAVGEIGLDYYHKKTESKIQINVFKQCLEIAIKYNKPVVLHIRDAYQDAYDVLSEYHARLSKILIHCYDGDAE